MEYTSRNSARLVLLAFALSALLAMAGDSDEKKDEKKEWDVNHFTDQTHEVAIDTDEGSWMSLDVSPDGKTIAFDLLGDIYTLPIGGGEATAIMTGMAWDMQPRFSPDGKSLAFTSDRGGGDNIWVADADGKNAHQVTKETFRLLNSPAWSPDGRFIVARKHFSSSRSLGAGELWLYHVSGGQSGVQLNEKPNDQKDLGEPAFSPDGRYVYFSQDTTPGRVFEYSKDPNPGIYSIRRLDLQKDEIENVISSTGGAVRPTPSPNGRYLAYVRRHQYQTKLFLHDLESGKNTVLYDGLDRDMQETWAIHGVYPTMGWLPDSSGLVFWAKGKLHRLDLATRQEQLIPFHLKATRTVAESLRSPVEVAPAKFKTRMLRWATTSPAGDKVVFQALGYLYLQSLPNGKPQRLTNQNDRFEFYPAWSRDGKQLAYVTWNDLSEGTLNVIATDGKSPAKVVSSKPGIFVEPCFTPDGKALVYRKSGGGGLLNQLYTKETGLYFQALDGSAPKRIVEEGDSPHFGAKGDRVFYLAYGKDDARILKSVDLNGKDPREHVTSEMGDELLVSPDGKWLAFTEHYNAHVMPFTLASKSFTISPDGGALPTAQVSRDAGQTLHWGGDSSRLYWSLGSKLFHRDLKDAFAFVSGAPAKLPEPGGESIDLGFEVDHDVPSGTVVFEGGRIVTMKGDEVIENGVLVVNGNRIQAIGRVGDVAIPDGAYRVDAKGKTLIPGLVDVHFHAGYGADEITPQQNWQTNASLAFGVTTTHNPSTDTTLAFATTEMTRAGVLTGPRIFSTGAILYGAKAPTLTAKIDSLDDALSHLRRLQDVGAFSVKSYNQPRRNQRQQVIEGARQLGMMVVPEGGSMFHHNMSMIADGHTGIEHSIPLAVLYKDVVQFWSGTKVGYTPTLGVAYGGISGENYWYQHTDVWSHPLLSLHVPPAVLEARARRRVMAPESEYNHIRVAEGCKKLLDAGVSVQLGAHGQREGLAAHWELWMFVQGGMTPLEALRCGTLNGAHYLGLDKEVGSLEVGKLADVAVIDQNPLEDIRNSDKVSMVMVNGRLYNAMTLDQVGNHPKPRKPYYWEGDGMAFPNGVSESHSEGKCMEH